MTDKLTGPSAAAGEIDNQYATWMTQVTARAKRLDAIEAIILKHCPQDKAAGKLVEALKECISWIQATTYMAKKLSPDFGGTKLKESEATMKVIGRTKAALAEYEANK